jgi:hypothetical protein
MNCLSCSFAADQQDPGNRITRKGTGYHKKSKVAIVDSRTGQGSDEEEGEHRLVRKGTGHPGQGRKKATAAYAWYMVCSTSNLMFTRLRTVEESEESEEAEDESHVQYGS